MSAFGESHGQQNHRTSKELLIILQILQRSIERLQCSFVRHHIVITNDYFVILRSLIIGLPFIFVSVLSIGKQRINKFVFFSKIDDIFFFVIYQYQPFKDKCF